MTYYNRGDHNVYDDRTGFKKKRSQCFKTWDNLIVDRKGWEIRHPQDFIKAYSDRQNVADARPVPTPEFLIPNQVKASDL